MKKLFMIFAICSMFLLVSCGSSSENEKAEQPDETADSDGTETPDEIEEPDETEQPEEIEEPDETEDKDAELSECSSGETKADCSEGKYSACNAEGKWETVSCPDEVSCKADGTCGECKDGDAKNCVNDKQNVGNALFCKEGLWAKEAAFCPGQKSCSMTDECYQCFYKCDTDWECSEDCGADTTCKEKCEKNAACKAECGDCDAKCGECVNKKQKNCTENEAGIGSAEICFNGKWAAGKNCSVVTNIEVSCSKKCNKPDSCTDEELDSECGECLNAEEPICINIKNNPYGDIPLSHEWQLVPCREGALQFSGPGYKPCADDCNEFRDECLEN